MERWKDVDGWEGIYQISSHGRLKSFKKIQSGYILSNKNRHGWYLTHNLCVIGRKRETKRIHVLVAKAFIPNPNNYPQINHKDMNKQNNHYKNLEWVTCEMNVKHAVKNNPNMMVGIKNYNQNIKPKPVMQLSMNGEFIGCWKNCIEASKATGVCARNIHQVASKTEYKKGLIRSQAGGYRWVFDD